MAKEVYIDPHPYCSDCKTCLHNCIEYHLEMAKQGKRMMLVAPI